MWDMWSFPFQVNLLLQCLTFYRGPPWPVESARQVVLRKRAAQPKRKYIKLIMVSRSNFLNKSLGKTDINPRSSNSFFSLEGFFDMMENTIFHPYNPIYIFIDINTFLHAVYMFPSRVPTPYLVPRSNCSIINSSSSTTIITSNWYYYLGLRSYCIYIYIYIHIYSTSTSTYTYHMYKTCTVWVKSGE